MDFANLNGLITCLGQFMTYSPHGKAFTRGRLGDRPDLDYHRFCGPEIQKALI